MIRSRLKPLLLLLCASLCTGQALALDWATKEVCTVTELQIIEEAFAPDRFEQIRAAARDVPNGQGKLWQITSETGAISFLWGTMHSSSPVILRQLEPVKDKIRSSRIVATEFDPRPQSRANITNAKNDTLRYKDGDQQKAEIPQGLDDDAIRWATPFLLGYEARPFEIWYYYTPAGVAEAMFYDPCLDFEHGIFPIQDNLILLEAALGGVDTTGLEDPDALILKLSEQYSDALAVAIINVMAPAYEPASSNIYRQTGLTLYARGLIGAMMAWERRDLERRYGASESTDMLALVDGYLLDERNINFANKIENELEQGGVFMAVGAFHLPGKGGLVALLRDRGYQLTRIALPGEDSERGEE